MPFLDDWFATRTAEQTVADEPFDPSLPPADGQPEAAAAPGGFLSSILGIGLSGLDTLDTVVDALGRPVRTLIGTQDAGRAFESIWNKDVALSGADLKKKLGVGNLGKADGRFQWGDVADFVADAGIEIGLDPLTYLTFGVGAAAKGAAKTTGVAGKTAKGGRAAVREAALYAQRMAAEGRWTREVAQDSVVKAARDAGIELSHADAVKRLRGTETFAERLRTGEDALLAIRIPGMGEAGQIDIIGKSAADAVEKIGAVGDIFGQALHNVAAKDIPMVSGLVDTAITMRKYFSDGSGLRGVDQVGEFAANPQMAMASAELDKVNAIGDKLRKIGVPESQLYWADSMIQSRLSVDHADELAKLTGASTDTIKATFKKRLDEADVADEMISMGVRQGWLPPERAEEFVSHMAEFADALENSYKTIAKAERAAGKRMSTLGAGALDKVREKREELTAALERAGYGTRWVTEFTEGGTGNPKDLEKLFQTEPNLQRALKANPDLANALNDYRRAFDMASTVPGYSFLRVSDQAMDVLFDAARNDPSKWRQFENLKGQIATKAEAEELVQALGTASLAGDTLPGAVNWKDLTQAFMSGWKADGAKGARDAIAEVRNKAGKFFEEHPGVALADRLDFMAKAVSKSNFIKGTREILGEELPKELLDLKNKKQMLEAELRGMGETGAARAEQVLPGMEDAAALRERGNINRSPGGSDFGLPSEATTHRQGNLFGEDLPIARGEQGGLGRTPDRGLYDPTQGNLFGGDVSLGGMESHVRGGSVPSLGGPRQGLLLGGEVRPEDAASYGRIPAGPLEGPAQDLLFGGREPLRPPGYSSVPSNLSAPISVPREAADLRRELAKKYGKPLPQTPQEAADLRRLEAKELAGKRLPTPENLRPADIADTTLPGDDAYKLAKRADLERQIRETQEAMDRIARPGGLGLGKGRTLASDVFGTLPEGMDDFVVTSEVARAIKRREELIRNPQSYGVVGKMIGPMNAAFKRFALWSPASLGRNYIGNQILRLQGGGLDTHSVLEAGKLIALSKKAAGGATDDLLQSMKDAKFLVDPATGTTVDGATLYTKLRDMGVVDTGFWSSEFKTGARQRAKRAGKLREGAEAGLDLFRSMSSVLENADKAGHVLARLRAGDSWEAAALSANQYLFNYRKVSPGINMLRRTGLAPFAAWSAKNIPLQFEKLFTRPGQYAAMLHIKNAFENGVDGVSSEDLPEWAKSRFGIVVGKDEKGNPQFITAEGLIPLADIPQVADIAGFMGEALGPIPKTLAAALTGVDTFTKREIEKFDGEMSVFKAGPAEVPISVWTEYGLKNFAPRIPELIDWTSRKLSATGHDDAKDAYSRANAHEAFLYPSRVRTADLSVQIPAQINHKKRQLGAIKKAAKETRNPVIRERYSRQIAEMEAEIRRLQSRR